MKKTGSAPNKDIYFFLIRSMLVLSALILFILSFWASGETFLGRDFTALNGEYISDAWIVDSRVKAAIVFVLFLGAVFGLRIIWDRSVRDKEKLSLCVLFIASAIMLICGFIFVRDNPYRMTGDQLNTFYAGVYASQPGLDIRYLMFSPGGYIGIYPQQKGLVFFYMLFSGLFKDNLEAAMKYLHLIYPQMILYFGFFSLKEEKVSAFSRCIYAALILFCFPLMIYIPFMYGDLGSIAFSFALTFFLIKFLNSPHISGLVLMFISGAMTVLLRMQSWIFLIAVCIVLILNLLNRKKVSLLLTGCILVLSAWLAVFAIDKGFEKASGYESVDGIPAICWVVMGLGEAPGGYGAYNRYNQEMFEEHGFDADKTALAAKGDLKERIRILRLNPGYTKVFFKTKLKMEWISPDFSAFASTRSWDVDSVEDTGSVPAWIADLYEGKLNGIVTKISNYYMDIIYMSCFLLAVLLLFKKRHSLLISDITCLSLIYMIGGFLFFAVWENNSRYNLPFYMFLILLVPVLIDMVNKAVFRAHMV